MHAYWNLIESYTTIFVCSQVPPRRPECAPSLNYCAKLENTPCGFLYTDDWLIHGYTIEISGMLVSKKCSQQNSSGKSCFLFTKQRSKTCNCYLFTDLVAVYNYYYWNIISPIILVSFCNQNSELHRNKGKSSTHSKSD